MTWNKRKGKWQANIHINQRKIHLGYYDSKEDASRVRIDAEKELFKEYRYKEE